jgi:hypothetical protein
MSNKIFNMIDIPSKNSDEKQHKLGLLWAKIEKNEIRNKKAQNKVDQLYQEYKGTIIPYIEQKIDAELNLIEYYIKHLNSKILTKQQKQDLISYVSYKIDKVDMSETVKYNDRVSNINKSINEYTHKYFKKEIKEDTDYFYNAFLKEIKDKFDIDMDIPQEIFEEAALTNDTSKLFDLLKSYTDKVEDDNVSKDNADDSEWNDYEYDYYKDEESIEADKIKEIFKGSQLNKIYKKIANVIHPDKEQDPELKKYKVSEMQKLIAAKKEGDVFSLIKMYQRYVPNGSLDLGDDAINNIEHLLEMQIRKLNYEHKDIFENQGHKTYVWKNYSASSKKKIRHKFDNEKEFIIKSIESIKLERSSCCTINKIKNKVKSFVKQYEYENNYEIY